MQKIFISCSSKDSKTARTICDAIEARGYNCWLASRDVGPGQNFQVEIVRAIRAAPLMILIFSANADNSGEIKKEVAVASQNNLTVIPVRIEDVTPSEAFIYELATRQWIDLFSDWERSIQQLLVQIAKILPPEMAAAAQPPVAQDIPAPPSSRSHGQSSPASRYEQQESKSAKPRLLYWGAGLTAVLLLVGWGAYGLLRSYPKISTPRSADVASQVTIPSGTSPAASPKPAADSTADIRMIEIDVWNSVKDSHDPEPLNAYLKKYPSGIFADAAKARIVALNKPAPVVKAAPPVQAAAAAPAPPAPGKVYGPQNRNARLILRIRAPTHIMVHGPDGRKYIDYDLTTGDSFLVPNTPGLTLTASHGAAVEIDRDGAATGMAGPDMQPVSDVPFDPQDIGKASNAPSAATSTAAAEGTVYGPLNRDARVVLRALSDTHITVDGPNGMVFSSPFYAGDSYRVPNIAGLILAATNVGAVEIDLDGVAMGRAGPAGRMSGGISLNPEAIMQRFNGNTGRP